MHVVYVSLRKQVVIDVGLYLTINYNFVHLNLNLNTGQVVQLMCSGAELKNYNNDNYIYIMNDQCFK